MVWQSIEVSKQAGGSSHSPNHNQLAWPLRVRVVLDANGPLSALIPITSNSNTQPISDISPGPSSSSKPTTDNRRRATTPTGPRKKSDAKPQPSLSLLDRIAPLPLAARVNGFDPPTCPARDRNLSAIPLNILNILLLILLFNLQVIFEWDTTYRTSFYTSSVEERS